MAGRSLSVSTAWGISAAALVVALILAALLAVIFLQETLWYVIVARVFSLERSRAAYGRFKRHVDRLFGGLIAGLAAKIALT